MKATFKRDYSYWPAWLPITVYFLAVIGLFIVMGIGGDNYYLLMMPVAFVFYFVAMIRNPFHITDDNKLTISYKDDGCGFDFEQIGKVKSNNTGYGIRMLVERVNLLRGSINYNKDEKEFVINIPLK